MFTHSKQAWQSQLRKDIAFCCNKLHQQCLQYKNFTNQPRTKVAKSSTLYCLCLLQSKSCLHRKKRNTNIFSSSCDKKQFYNKTLPSHGVIICHRHYFSKSVDVIIEFSKMFYSKSALNFIFNMMRIVMKVFTISQNSRSERVSEMLVCTHGHTHSVPQVNRSTQRGANSIRLLLNV